MAMTERYCVPWNTGLNSTNKATARKLGAMFDAMDAIDRNLIRGAITDDVRRMRMELTDALEADGWTVSYQTGNLKGSNRCHVYPPGSKAGERIRADREAVTK